MLRNEYVEHDERLENGKRIFTDTIALKPVNWRKDGSLRRMTNLLGASGDPAMPIGCDELATFRVDPRIAGKSPLFHFGKGQSFAKIALLNANNVSGTVNGNKATFVNAWNGADLHLADGGHFIQFVAPLKANHPRSFAFRVDSHAGFDPLTLRFGQDFSLSQPVLVKDMLTVPLQWVVTQSGGKYILTVTLPAGDWSGWVLDPTLTLQPDAAGKDTYIDSANTDSNRGAVNVVYIGMAGGSAPRTLIAFDLSTLPSNAVISSATLSLYCTADYSSNARTFRVYRLKRAWTEGTTSHPATSGATYDKYDSALNLSWQTAGGFGVDDCEQTEIGSRAFTASETINEFKTFTLTPTTKTGLDLGYGWLIKADTENSDCYEFASSDHADAAKRPTFSATYTLPGGGGIFGSSVMHSAIMNGTITR